MCIRDREWYRVGDDMNAGIALLSEFVADLLSCPSAEVTSISEICKRTIGIDLLSSSSKEMAQLCEQHSVSVPSIAEDDWDTWFDVLFSTLVQLKLGLETPVIVHDYPASQAALARVRNDTPPVAERFELFYRGVELANGYHELLDADELLQRNRKVNEQRLADDKAALPESSRLVNAMQSGLPPCAGVALGFDRLVMLGVGANSISEVIPFLIDRA